MYLLSYLGLNDGSSVPFTFPVAAVSYLHNHLSCALGTLCLDSKKLNTSNNVHKVVQYSTYNMSLIPVFPPAYNDRQYEYLYP